MILSLYTQFCWVAAICFLFSLIYSLCETVRRAHNSLDMLAFLDCFFTVGYFVWQFRVEIVWYFVFCALVCLGMAYFRVNTMYGHVGWFCQGILLDHGLLFCSYISFYQNMQKCVCTNNDFFLYGWYEIMLFFQGKKICDITHMW